MKLNVLTVLNDITGKPIMAPATPGQEAEPMVLADVLVNAVMAPPAPGHSYTSAQQIERYDLGIAVHKARIAERGDSIEVEISSQMATSLKDDIGRLYAPVVAGQVLPMLDGK